MRILGQRIGVAVGINPDEYAAGAAAIYADADMVIPAQEIATEKSGVRYGSRFAQSPRLIRASLSVRGK